ncbi:MAG: M23 family metallopeptidase [Oscillospiraceae bacterium]|nr:M23 family metallopeptidase [Oscillospiraceae bacterium]
MQEFQDYDAELSCGESDTRFADIRAARERRRALREGVYDEPELARAFDADGEKPRGALLRVILTQVVVCALLLGGLLLAQKAMPHTYQHLHKAYTQVMQTDLSAREVWAAIKGAFGSLKDEIYVVAPAQDSNIDQPNTEAAQPTSRTAGAAGGKDVAAAFADRNCSILPLITTVPPVPPLQAGRLTSPFGLRTHPITGQRSVHTGMDIGAAMGEPIAAAFFGRVVKAGEDADYGNFILMEHEGGLQTLYGHCSVLLAEEGMVLRAGEIIALVGSTGVSTGPHLHFEVRLHGVRCNPEPLLRGVYDVKEG